MVLCLGLVHHVSAGGKVPLARSTSTTLTDVPLIMASIVSLFMSHLLYLIVSPFFHIRTILDPLLD